MYILHGENSIQSRQKLTELIAQAKSSGRQTKTLTAKKLTVPNLEQSLGNQSLFGAEQTVIIEELHSLPTSKRKKQLIELLATAATQSASSSLAIILWEKRDLTKTMLKKFSGATELSFKASKKIFKFVEQISPQTNKKTILTLLGESVASDGDFFVFTMITRQIRMLLEVKDGARPAGPPFVVAKLESQARGFTMDALLAAHKQLVQIDLNIKQSASPLSLAQQLDLFIFRL